MDKIGRYLRMSEGQFFMERVEERHRRTLGSLRNNIDLIEIGRSQGQLNILDWILRMREEGGD